MSKPVILTDSACDIPFELAKEYNIQILNFSIAVDGVNYVERVDFTPEGFVQLLNNCKEIPRTAHITSLQFMDRYEELEAEGYTDIIHVTINSAGSNTYDAALLAKKNFFEEYPNSSVRIHVIDSGTYSMGYGYFLCEAAKKLRAGASVVEVIADLERAFQKVDIILGVFSLKFVKKSGRISAAAAFAGEVMGLRPVIRLRDGTTTVVDKVRGDKKVLPAMVRQMQASLAQQSPYCIGYTQRETAEQLAELCEETLGYPPAHLFPLGAAVASNTGPDGIGLVFLDL